MCLPAVDSWIMARRHHPHGGGLLGVCLKAIDFWIMARRHHPHGGGLLGVCLPAIDLWIKARRHHPHGGGLLGLHRAAPLPGRQREDRRVGRVGAHHQRRRRARAAPHAGAPCPLLSLLMQGHVQAQGSRSRKACRHMVRTLCYKKRPAKQRWFSAPATLSSGKQWKTLPIMRYA